MNSIIEDIHNLVLEQAGFLQEKTEGLLIGKITFTPEEPLRRINLLAQSKAEPDIDLLLLYIGIWGPRLDCMIEISKSRRLIDVGPLTSDMGPFTGALQEALHDKDLLDTVAGFLATERDVRPMAKKRPDWVR